MEKGKPQGRHKNIFNMHKQKTKAMPATKLIKMCAKLADCGTEGAEAAGSKRVYIFSANLKNSS